MHQARYLQPGDLFRDDGRLLRVARIAVSPDTVELTAEILIDGVARGKATLRAKADAAVRVLTTNEPVAQPARPELTGV